MRNIMTLVLAIALFAESINSATYDMIKNVQIKDKQLSPWKVRSFIRPNELRPELFKDVLQNRKGILISVGTLRGLIAFSMGDFDYLVMMDIDSNVRAFNRELLDYIKNLMAKYPDDIASQRRDFKQSKYSFSDVYELPYFWGNDEDWKKITKALSENRIYVIDGDLNNPESVRELKFALDSLGMLPRTFDISNVLDYMGDSYEGVRKTLSILSQNQNIDHVILTMVGGLHKKEIPQVCYPIKLGSHSHGDASFTYYHSSLGDFSKYSKVRAGFPVEDSNISSCLEVKLSKNEIPIRPNSKIMKTVYEYQK